MSIDQIFKGMNSRLWTITILVILSSSILLAKLWYEQLRLGKQYRQQILKQSIRQIWISPTRGRIISSDGVLLADNKLAFDLVFHLHEMRRPGRFQHTLDHIQQQAMRINRLIRRSNSLTEDQIHYHIKRYPARPIVIFSDLNDTELTRLYESDIDKKGIDIQVNSHRIYPMGAIGAHSIGFVGHRRLSEKKMKNYSPAYVSVEPVGRAGLEYVYNTRLGGIGGRRTIRVNHLGFHHDSIQSTSAVHGNDLVLTVNSKAQLIAQKLLDKKKGAIVLLDCRRGAVLAMVSSPSYDLNTLGKTYSKLAKDENNRPLVNRALAAGYLPGSIIKPLIAIAALREKVITLHTMFKCQGYYRVANEEIACFNRIPHGQIIVNDALKVSCNAFFIHCGLKLGLDRLQSLLGLAGIGSKPSLELQPGNMRGTYPSRKLIQKYYQRKWTTIDTALISIGQGFISLSPLQAAVYTVAIANGGTLYQPYLVQRRKNDDMAIKQDTSQDDHRSLGLAQNTLRHIRRAMHQVVWAHRGTGQSAQSASMMLAGKTGTTEIGNGQYNTWFICFGPYQNPRYAMAILVENGESGGITAAPLAKQFFEQFLAEDVEALDQK